MHKEYDYVEYVWALLLCVLFIVFSEDPLMQLQILDSVRSAAVGILRVHEEIYEQGKEDRLKNTTLRKLMNARHCSCFSSVYSYM